MDPLSITASVIAVLTAAGQVADGLSKLKALISCAQDEVCQLLNEVADLELVIHQIEAATENLPAAMNQETSGIRRSMDRAEKKLLELRDLIENRLGIPLSQNLDKLNKPDTLRISKLKWVKESQKAREIQKDLRSIRQSLSLGLLAFNTYISLHLDLSNVF